MFDQASPYDFWNSSLSITVQNPGKWLTWNICTGGMGYARDAGMYWVLSINMNYLHWGVWGIKQIQSTWNICTDGMGSTGYAGNAGMYRVLSIDRSTLTPKHHYHCLTLGPYPQNTKAALALANMPGGLGGPTQYSILNTVPLDPNPRPLNIFGSGQRCWQICQGA